MTPREAIRQMVKQEATLRLAEVESVQLGSNSCTVIPFDNEDAKITEVRLQVSAASGLLMVPAVGSTVLIGPCAEFSYGVIMFSELSDISLLDGSFGGMVKVSSLVSKLNALESKVNGLITWGLTVTPPFTPATLLTQTVVADLENPKVKHGDV